MRRAGVGRNGGGGNGNGGGTIAGAVEDVWAAAGMEHARAAAMHQCSTMDACQHSWMARVDAGDAMRDAAVANGRVVGESGGRISRGAIAENAAAMDRAADALDRAAVEFRMASKLSVMAADGWARAAKALERSRHGEASAVHSRSDDARKMAQTLEAWAEKSRLSAVDFRRSAGEWVRDTAKWPDGSMFDGDRDEWMKSQGVLLSVAGEERTMGEKMLKSTDETAQVAACDLRQIAAEADRRTGAAELAAANAVAAATAVPASVDRAGFDAMREAAAALREGMEAARQAAKDSR